MSTARKKLLNWDGPNKQRSRTKKISELLRAQSKGHVEKFPWVLTFAGAPAHFEQQLVKRGVTCAERLITIQRCSSRPDAAILRKLLKTRNQKLPGMFVWPWHFSDFSKGYSGNEVSVPSFGSGQAPSWYKEKLFRKEMLRFVDHKPQRFGILDVDFCGIFSKENASSVLSLLKGQMLASKGMLFINHQKGRDGRFGALFSFLKDYFRYSEHFDISKLVGEGLDLNQEDEESFYFVRYILVPIYYVCEAYTNGYQLKVNRLFEYRDRNPKSKQGVVMLQWFFSFRALSKDPGRKTTEIQRLRDTLGVISREAYPYTESLD